jgi:hypothetical protein
MSTSSVQHRLCSFLAPLLRLFDLILASSLDIQIFSEQSLLPEDLLEEESFPADFRRGKEEDSMAARAQDPRVPIANQNFSLRVVEPSQVRNTAFAFVFFCVPTT